MGKANLQSSLSRSVKSKYRLALTNQIYNIYKTISNMDASQFSASDSAHLNRLIEQKQMKDFLKLYSSLVERCFVSCCNDFTSRALSTKEETCVNHCTDKFLKHSERVGARFSEHN